MKAVVADRYGGPEVMELRDVPTPEPKPGQVLVRVAATTLQALDWHYLRGEPLFMRLMTGLRPRRQVHGADLAGTVEALGEGVTTLAVGDEVVGWTGGGGGLAEYAAVAEDTLLPAPANLDLRDAAALGVAAYTALQAVREEGEIAEGDRVLVVGASGGVGTFAVQLARAFGAAHVTGTCSTHNLDLVRSLGVDEVIDRTVEDWRDRDATWDCILQVAGDVDWSRTEPRLTADGRYVLVGSNTPGRWLGPAKPFLALKVRQLRDGRNRSFDAAPSRERVQTLLELAEAGRIRPVIDRTFPLADASDAMAYVEQGRASGKVLVTP